MFRARVVTPRIAGSRAIYDEDTIALPPKLRDESLANALPLRHYRRAGAARMVSYLKPLLLHVIPRYWSFSPPQGSAKSQPTQYRVGLRATTCHLS